MRIALMQKNRLADLRGDFQLRDERTALVVRRREIAKIVEAAFTHRDDMFKLQKADQLLALCGNESLRMMGMHSRRAPKTLRMLGGEGGSLAGTGKIRARDQLAPHAGLPGARHHRVTICRKTLMCQVRSNIDQIQAQDPKPRCDIFACILSARNLMPMRDILLTAILLTAVAAQAQEGGDTQARIDYAYQTEDINSL